MFPLTSPLKLLLSRLLNITPIIKYSCQISACICTWTALPLSTVDNSNFLTQTFYFISKVPCYYLFVSYLTVMSHLPVPVSLIILTSKFWCILAHVLCARMYHIYFLGTFTHLLLSVTRTWYDYSHGKPKFINLSRASPLDYRCIF